MSETGTALAHHFDTLEQQKESATLGMWIFLVTEIMFFGGLILAYVVYRSLYHDAFKYASHHLNVDLGLINTVVLICSSLTMALAVHFAQVKKQRNLILFLILTILLGSVFLGIKVFEYYDKYQHNLIPGPSFKFEMTAIEGPAELFYSLYFALTGLHALHMIIGISILAVLCFQSWGGRYTSGYYWPVELTGLYWHFVDIVWIFLFPFLYLISRHA